MAKRSLQASAQGIQTIKKALRSQKLSQQYLADLVGCSRQTIWSLLQGNPTDWNVFTGICQQLSLKWEEIAETESVVQPNSSTAEEIIQRLRNGIKPYIQERCGTMRVLDMEHPIGLNAIYTNVNILEKVTGRRGLELSDLFVNLDLEHLDRFCLGKVREKRVPGLEVVEKFSKLMILGKPGAGKTTFLKYLAIQCINEKFYSNKVPIFIALKDFVEADGQPTLLAYLEQLFPPAVFRQESGIEGLISPPIRNIKED
jgi:predicted NACHT family NTPase